MILVVSVGSIRFRLRNAFSIVVVVPCIALLTLTTATTTTTTAIATTAAFTFAIRCGYRAFGYRSTISRQFAFDCDYGQHFTRLTRFARLPWWALAARLVLRRGLTFDSLDGNWRCIGTRPLFAALALTILTIAAFLAIFARLTIFTWCAFLTRRALCLALTRFAVFARLLAVTWLALAITTSCIATVTTT